MAEKISKEAIVILGMHRSGTSMMAGSLSKLGYDIGKSKMLPSDDNKRGFYENTKIVKLNDFILKKNESNWDNILKFDRAILKDDDLLKLTINTLKQEFVGNKILIKDPRLSITYPLWRSALLELNFTLKVIVCFRRPNDVHYSLLRRDNFEVLKSSLLYAYYSYWAEFETREDDRLLLSIESILDNKSRLFDIANFVKPDIRNDIVHRASDHISRALIQKSPHDSFDKDYFSINKFYKAVTINQLDKEWSDDQRSQLMSYITEVNGIIEKKYSGIILVDRGNGFDLKEKYVFDVALGEVKIEQAIPMIEDVVQIKIVPCKRACILTIDYLHFDQDSYLDRVKTNAEATQGNIYFFGSTHPWIVFNVANKDKFGLLSFSFNYYTIDGNVLLLSDYVHKLNYILSGLEKINKSNEIDKLKATLDLFQLLKEEWNIYIDKSKLVTSLDEVVKTNMNSSDMLRRMQGDVKLLNSAISIFEEENSEYKDMNAKLHKECNNYNHKLSRLKKKNNKLKIKINGLKNEQAEAIILIEELKKYKETVHRQHHEILKFKKDYSDRENEIVALKNSLWYKVANIFHRDNNLLMMFFRTIKRAIMSVWVVLVIFVQRPVKTLSQFGVKDIYTLFRAIRKERPSDIRRNLMIKLGLPFGAINNESIGENVSLNMGKRSGDLQVLYISPNLPYFDKSSGGRRSLRMIELMSSMSKVTVFTLGDRPALYREKIEESGASVITHGSQERLIQEIQPPDIIIFAWFYTLHDTSKIYQQYPRAYKIVDSVDIHWVREERSVGLSSGLDVDIIERNKKVEIDAYKNADEVWVVTKEDGEALHVVLPDKKINVVSNIHNIHKGYHKKLKNSSFLFFGGFNHPPNIDALEVLVTEVLPKILNLLPGAQLIVAGANASNEVKALCDRDNVEFRGFIEEKDLHQLYEDATFSIAPLLSGAGIKGKICEAISFGLPVLTNSIGNEGINLVHEIDGFLSSNENMHKVAVDILTGKYDLQAIVSAAQEKLLNVVGPPLVADRMYSSFHRIVNICIVTFNKIELLKKCIESILDNTEYRTYNIIVYSNGCQDGTKEYLQELQDTLSNVIAVLSHDNDVFVKPSNHMMKMDECADVVLLNNDTVVVKGWLRELRKTAYLSNQIGIVGSKLYYPNGKLQEFGSELYANGTGRNIGKNDDPNKSEYQGIRRVGYVSGCSMYIKRKTIQRIGYLDELYHPCYCEDSDYSYRAWLEGIQTVVTSESKVIHYEGGTSGTDVNTGFKKYQEINMKKFINRHGMNLDGVASRIAHHNQINSEYG